MQALLDKLNLFVLAQEVTVPKASLGFDVSNLYFDKILSFVIKFFFIIAGLVALLYLILGAFSWITSGGEKEAVGKAREKIQAAVIGLILVFLVLGIVILLESILNIGLGISREIQFPRLIQR